MARPLVATKPPRNSTVDVDVPVEPPRRRRLPGRRRALVGWMSLHRWPLLGEPELNFPDNYTGAADNDLIRDAAWFTAKYTVVITVLLFVLAFVLAFALALLVQRRRRGVGFFRTAFILPMAVGFASASLLFLGMLIAVVNMRTATHGSIDYAALEAGVVVMAVPCLLLFLFMQRGYVRGFMSGALKG